MAYNVNENDLAARLSNHYAMYKGIPYFCEAKMTDGGYDPDTGNYHYQLWGYEVGTRKASIRLDPTEASFSAASVQFGFCYDAKGNLAYVDNGSDRRVAWAAGGKASFSIPNSRDPKMADCIAGKHIKFSEAVKKVITGEAIAAAFDRHFALYVDGMFNEIQVIHKTRVIGFYTKKDGKIRLRGGPIVKLIKRKLDKLMET